MWLLVAPRAAKGLMVMRASGSSRPILASTPRNGVVRGSQPETTARKSGRRLTRRCPVALHRARAVGSMELKHVLGEIEADGANLVHGRLLEWALTPPLWHAEAVGGVHTITPPLSTSDQALFRLAADSLPVRRSA